MFDSGATLYVPAPPVEVEPPAEVVALSEPWPLGDDDQQPEELWLTGAVVAPKEEAPPMDPVPPFDLGEAAVDEVAAWVEATDAEVAEGLGLVDPRVDLMELAQVTDPVAQEVAALVCAELDDVAAAEALEELDAPATLERVARRQRLIRRLQGEELALAAHWADLHGTVDLPTELARRGVAGVERLVQLGGDGSPAVAEFAVPELAVVLGLSDVMVDRLVADALDLRHRLPQLWRRIQAGDVDVWTARRTAEHIRGLSAAAAGRVDTRVAAVVGRLTWRRLKPVLDAAMTAADPPQAISDAAAAADVGVWLDDENRHGYGSMLIRAAAGDLAALDQSLNLIARALRTLGDSRSRQLRRAAAIAILACPATAQQLIDLAEETRRLRIDAATARRSGRQEDPDRLTAEADTLAATWTRTLSRPTAEPTAEPPGDPSADVRSTPDADGNPLGLIPLGGNALGAQRPVDRRPLAFTSATVYYHLTCDTLAEWLAGRPDAAAGTVRVEEVGPVILDQVRRWLQHANVVVKPVLDLENVAPLDRYEVTPPIAEAIGLRFPADYSPYATSLSRRQDHDHTVPYLAMEDCGPPDQTDPARMGRLTRRRHRLKTHGGWTVHQIGPLAWLWRTRQGHGYLVNAYGTTPLGKV